MTEQHQPEPPVAQTTCASARRASFRWLWSGQLISNLGTQTSLYGIGLWLFARSGRLLDFGMVALVVQLARLLALPLLTSRLHRWPPARLMVLAHGIGALCTFALAWVLLGGLPLGPSAWSLLPILLIQAVAAMAEATLVVRCSSLIPVLIADGPSLIRANGLFATTDGLVVTMAPFLGAWLVSALGLPGVLALDGISFVLAIGCVLAAPWGEARLSSSLPQPASPAIPWHAWVGRLQRGWRERPSMRRALVLSAVVMGIYGACEIVFPAWVAAGWGSTRMGEVLVLGSGGYLVGFMAWRLGLGLSWQRSGNLLLLLQGLILLGAGVPALAQQQQLWWAGVFGFSVGLPVVTAALHQAWVTLAQQSDPPRVFALRYGSEWSSRLVAFLGVPLVVDRLVRPGVSTMGPEESAQTLAFTLAVLGGVLVFTVLLAPPARSVEPQT